jgi:FeS assembly SUF system protein
MSNDHLTLHDFMPGGLGQSVTDGYIARAGDSNPDLNAKPSTDDIITALSSVFDPEIPVNIYDLGLIYDIKPNDNGDVYITMSLTAPGCPVAGILPQQAADAVAALDMVGLVEVELIWDPPWTKDRMSDDARLALDMF